MFKLPKTTKTAAIKSIKMISTFRISEWNFKWIYKWITKHISVEIVQKFVTKRRRKVWTQNLKNKTGSEEPICGPKGAPSMQQKAAALRSSWKKVVRRAAIFPVFINKTTQDLKCVQNNF